MLLKDNIQRFLCNRVYLGLAGSLPSADSPPLKAWLLDDVIRAAPDHSNMITPFTPVERAE